jgi:hypothetical protein
MEITNDTLATTFRTSGLTQTAFCSQNGISLERLRYYLYKKNKSHSTRLRKRLVDKPLSNFIQLNNASSLRPAISLNGSFTATIIQGTFTTESLALLLKELNKPC